MLERLLSILLLIALLIVDDFSAIPKPVQQAQTVQASRLTELVEDSSCSGVVLPAAHSVYLPLLAASAGRASLRLVTPPQAIPATITLDPLRAATIRGRVCSRAGAPIAGVEVGVLHGTEYGSVLTNATGEFVLPVNGGDTLTLNHAKAGYLPSQRQVRISALDDLRTPEVVLIPYDQNVTTVTLGPNSSMQVARGSVSVDEDGARQATTLFPGGTTAQMVMPDGSTRPLTTLNVRATEYTVGPSGPAAMPAPLPAATGYTYAVALDVDEAVAAGAHEVRFSQPVYQYLENFLGFPVGMAVPSGYYDEQQGAWVPSTDGRVVKVTAINGGLAELDTDGDGTADNDAALGITADERGRLATLYQPGQTLWRVPITHFSDYDYNWNTRPDCDSQLQSCASDQGSPEPVVQATNEPICRAGSIIECQNQILGEQLGVTGTPFGLHYASDRVPGYRAAYKLDIPLSGTSYPGTLKRIELSIRVAGRSFTIPFTPTTGLRYTFEWDGKNAAGQIVAGQWPVHVGVGYVYNAVYMTPAQRAIAIIDARSFGHFTYDGAPATGDRARQEITLWRYYDLMVGSPQPRDYGLGGWSLSALHAYDPRSQTLTLGNGERRSAESLNFNTITTVAGSGRACNNIPACVDGVPATQAQFRSLGNVVVAPDGTLYITDDVVRRVRRVDSDGVIRNFAGGGPLCRATTDPCGDGGPATAAGLISSSSIALGPDGSLYIGGPQAYKIRRVAPDGTISTLAGTGVLGFSGDNGPATSAQIGRVLTLAFGPDGSLYFTDNDASGAGRIRKIAPDGIISTVIGNGTRAMRDGDPAAAMRLGLVSSLAIGSAGEIFFVHVTVNNLYSIHQVSGDGRLTTLISGANGVCAPLASCGDGGPAKTAQLGNTGGLAVTAEGALLFASNARRIRQIGTDGIVNSIAGTGQDCGFPTTAPCGDGGPALQARFRLPNAIEVAPDGSIFVVDPHMVRVRRLAGVKLRVATSVNDLLIAAEDGSELYLFDSSGRHLRTVNALTGAIVFEFAYDGAGRVMSITDGDGNVTQIERGPGGAPQAIVGPDGQRTTFTTDANGYLSRVANPAGEAFELVYSTDGLLTRFADPRGNASSFTYDGDGLLVRDTDAAGGFAQLTRSGKANSHTVSFATALARTTQYGIERDLVGNERQVTTLPDGTQSIRSFNADATRSTTTPDGTTTSTTLGPNPRWMMTAPIITSATIRTPAGLNATITTAQTATLTDPRDLLSISSLNETVTVNGRAYTSSYTASSRTLTQTTPEGRQSSVQVDTQGRPLLAQIAGLLPTSVSYDARGRLTAMTQGSGATARTATITYNAAGYPDTITDPLGRVTRLAYDGAGRVTEQTTPEGHTIRFSYDASGNLASLTPPGRPAHRFTYTARDEVASYTPPTVAGTGATQYRYNLDRQPTQVIRPDGVSIDLSYDPAGRPDSLSIPRGTFSYTYNAATGTLATIAAPGSIGLAYTYDGFLTTGETWSGPVAGSVGYSYDNDFRLASSSVNGGNAVAFQYDDDSLLTKAGDLTLRPDPQNGLLSGSTLGGVSDSWSYNGFAEPTNYSASHGGTALYSVSYTRDALGRITTKSETIGGATTSYGYSYDLAGRLIEVKQNGATVATYTYGANGNRLSGPGVASASYDDQDRLLSYGANGYTYSANGELKTRTAGGQNTSYQYDELGSLLGVTLPDGTQIGYLIDGQGRRVGRQVNGTLTHGWLYEGQLRPVAELDSAGNIVSRFVYATRVNVPDYMVKGGATYRIITDQLGSPRLVVNVADGSVAQRMDYDAWGNVTQDTNPGFQPFGFAGGLYDPATKLVRFGARDYDAEVGRWTAKDPIGFAGGDSNLYSYVTNRPINFLDPSGTYSYTYDWVIGPTTPLMDARRAMDLMKSQPNLIFPFEVQGVNGENKIILGREYNLNRVRTWPLLWFGDNGNRVKVTSCTNDSFTFTTLPGHFDPPGSTITFRIYTDVKGIIHLEQRGVTNGEIFFDRITERGAKMTWERQADNLKRAIYAK